MMGHREPLVNGDEQDWLTKSRKLYGRPHRAKEIKRDFGKRVRRAGRRDAIEQTVETQREG